MLELNGKKLFFGDLHIHSRFSRACSKDLRVETLEKWAKIKGIDILGTGDFTHPVWLEELKGELEEKNGLLYSKNGFKFVLTGEVSLIYTQGRGRRVHLVLLVPSFEIADKINAWLDTKGRRDYDGRPIFKISCEDFAAKMEEIDEGIEIIPAHVWTPWFGLYGSASGFDSLKEAFGSRAERIHAVETGISSTPDMNLKLDELKEMSIVSFSDSHSYWPWRLGREVTIFSSIKSYRDILEQIRKNEILGTVEVNPAYGKYHFDGHRKCNYSCSPEEAEKYGNICPVCKKALVLGVEHRVEDLSGDDRKSDKIVFEVLPLHEVISTALGVGMNTKKVWRVYNKLIEEFGNEFEILLKVEKEKIAKFVEGSVLDLIIKNREGKIKVRPGFDGIYGEMILEEKKSLF